MQGPTCPATLGARRVGGKLNRTARSLVALAQALLVTACDGEPCPELPADAAAILDAAPGPDGAAPDAQLARVDLTDGAVLVGELVATYDRGRWWDSPGPGLIHALFDPARYAEWPDDRALTFVDSTDVVTLTGLAWPPGRPGYREVLRGHGIALHQLPLEGVSHVITAHDGYHLEENGYGDFAWDLVLTDTQGARFTGDGTRNEDYLVWDAPVRLPTAGLVVEVTGDATDNSPGAYPPDAVNNLVGVHLGGSFYLYLLHLRQGSIPDDVAVGAHLPAGTLLGRVGNAGVSLEPHLHVALVWYDETAAPPRSFGVPCEIYGVWIAPSPVGPSRLNATGDPPTGSWIAAEPF